MNWRKFQRHLKSTFAIILANHLLLVANLMMIVFSCKKELKEHQTIPKENKSKSFFSKWHCFYRCPFISKKKPANLESFFFLCSFITFIFRWKVSELIINGVKRQDDGLYECQARNEGGQFFKSGHIQVRRNCMYILRPKPNCFWWRNYVENYYLCMKFAAFIVAPNVDFVIFLPMFVRVRMLWQV